MFSHLNPHSSDFGDICALYSPFLHQLTNLLFLNLGVYGFAQATVGVGTVFMWDFCVAYTRGGVTLEGLARAIRYIEPTVHHWPTAVPWTHTVRVRCRRSKRKASQDASSESFFR